MKSAAFLLLFFCVCIHAFAQKPRNGTYIYDIAFAEWGGRSHGSTCKVIVKGDSIKVLHNGGNLSGTKGEVIAEGVIMWHAKTMQWIIGHTPADKNAEDVGDCSEGPLVIDFKRKKFWLC